MISSTDLGAMRAVQTATLTLSAQIQRVVVVSDGMGGETQSWSVAATVACRVKPEMPRQGIIAGRLVEDMGYRVTFPALTDVRVGDRLLVGAKGYEILGVLAPSTLETARVCICVEREPVIITPVVPTNFVGFDFSQAANAVYRVLL